MDNKPLSAYERWMVKSNLDTAKTIGLEVVLAHLRANGYDRIADAVQQTYN